MDSAAIFEVLLYYIIVQVGPRTVNVSTRNEVDR
jgi:hypothetical protein